MKNDISRPPEYYNNTNNAVQSDFKLNREPLINAIEKLLDTGESTSHDKILDQLISKILPINFNELAELSEDEKLKNSHYQIIVSEQLLALALDNNWGLCQKNDYIYLYNGAYWTLLEKGEVRNFLGEVAEKMGVPKFKARQFQFRENLHKQFIVLGNLPKPDQTSNSILINLKNGTFEISDTEIKLKAFNRSDFLTYQLPFNYNPQAKAQIFQSYLDKVLPEKDRQRVLSEYLGYIFVQPNTLKLEKALILNGTGSNGKSVFFDIVNALLGKSNIVSYSLKSLTDSSGYYRAKLANKLLNYASEINANLETSIFKQLVSGEPVEARLPYGDPFVLDNYAKFIFNCNELPKDVEHTRAYFRRFLIMPFDVSIPENEQDKQLAQKIIASELSGVFNWVLDGLHNLLAQRGFTECEASRIALEEYEKQSDSVRLFIDEREYLSSHSEYILIKELYLDYRIFCNDDGYRPVHKSNFIKRLKGLNVVVQKKNIGNVAYLSMELEICK